MSTEAKKRQLKEQRDKSIEELFDLCTEHNMTIEDVNNDYQLRINGVMDVYPTNRKYCLIKKQRWGQYNRTEDLLEIIKKV